MKNMKYFEQKKSKENYSLISKVDPYISFVYEHENHKNYEEKN